MLDSPLVGLGRSPSVPARASDVRGCVANDDRFRDDNGEGKPGASAP
jgi:hypothetical protein